MPIKIRHYLNREIELIRGSQLKGDSFLMIRGDVLHVWILLMSTVFSSLYSVIDVILGTDDEAFFVSLPAVASLICYFVFFRRGYKLISKIIIVTLMLVVISVLCIMEGAETGVLVFFIPILVATQITFQEKQRKYAIWLTVIAGVTLVVLLLLDTSHRHNHLISETEMRTEWILNFSGGILATIFQVWFLLSVSNDLQNELLGTADSLKAVNADLTRLLKVNAEKTEQIGEQMVLLRKAEQEAKKLSFIATHTHNSVIVTDAHGCLEWVNKAFEDLTGWQLREIIGKKPKEFLLGNDTSAEISKMISDKLKKHEFFETTILNYTKTGVPYYNRLEITPLFDEYGKVVNYFSIQRDVTAEITAQERIMEEQKKQQKLIAQIAIQAHEIEQNHIATELHENINQILAAAKMHLDLYKGGLVIPDQHLNTAYDHIGKALTEINSLSHALAVPIDAGFDLADAIGDMVVDFESRTDVMVDLQTEMDDDIELSEEIRLAGYRIVQEQLNNVEEHAKAHNIHLTLNSRKEGLYITIDDDGIGFDVHEHAKGIGLTKIESRVRFHAGEMHITSEPGNGCKLDVFLPVQG